MTLLDTNVLLRYLSPADPAHATATAAIAAVQASGEMPCIVPQNLYEFWVVATRPVALNGLGLDAAQAAAELTRAQSLFALLPDTPAVFVAWQQLVTTHNVLGKNAHDARLVAAMAVHTVTRLLTFNTADFARFPGITVLDPVSLATPPTP